MELNKKEVMRYEIEDKNIELGVSENDQNMENPWIVLN